MSSSVNSRGLLVVLSGFSGAGKGTLVKKLLSAHDNYSLSVSATTRAPREGETHGKDYFFVSREEFEAMIRDNALIEYASYVGNYYGTPRAYVEQELAAGRDVLLEIEIQGAQKIRQLYPDSLLIFVAPPSASELFRRLTGRGTETEEQIRGRLQRAVEESRFMDDYDYLLVNDDLDEAAAFLHSLIDGQHARMADCREFADALRQDMTSLITEGGL